ncbi:MAG: DUF4835 family protein [Porphyromonadaceae bacterium]|jgi:hypothetical protein|nr:DUF4835 family protein [Porphyromonadaceae bacterium]
MKLKLTILLIISLFAGTAKAQELNCNLQINSDKIQGSNKSVFQTLQKAANEFLNNRKWTELSYGENERIECNINIIINSADGDSYSAEMVVQSRRPVFNSSYSTTLLNHRDLKLQFNYREFEPLEFNSSNLNNNLTAVLAFYAYLIIGYDMDSFSRLGGTPYFQVAENIVSQAQSTDWSGWKAFDKEKNRYDLISNIMDEAFKKYREYFYEYHRLGLDEMSINSTNGRAKIASGIQVLQDVYRARPTTVIISSFLDSKSDELINVFKKGTADEKKLVVDVLTTVNPSQTNRYEQIMRN